MSLAGVACLSRLSCEKDADGSKGCGAFGGLWASSRDGGWRDTIYYYFNVSNDSYECLHRNVRMSSGRRCWRIGGRGLLPLKGGERVLLEWML